MAKSNTKQQPDQSQQKQGSLQKIWQKIVDHPFWENDGTLTSYLAHGATELANFIVHGHAAPMYGRSVSPPDSQSPEAPDTQTDQPPTQIQAATSPLVEQPNQQQPSIIDKHLSDIGAPASQSPDLTLTAPDVSEVHATPPSFIDQHLHDVQQSTPDISEPHMELDK